MNSQRMSYEVVKASFEKEGYTLLTKTYENNTQKLEYICKRDHRHSIIWGDWNSKKKYRCPYCANNAKLNIEFIRAEFAKEGYTLLTTVYEGNRQKLEYICKRGHRHSITWGHWNSKKKHRCPFCNGTARLKIEFIRAEFAKEGYILLTKVYKNSRQKLKYICPIGHKHSITWDDWNSKNKRRCPYCIGKGKQTIESIRAAFKKEGYILLTKVYKNVHQKLEYICPRGHKHSVRWSDWNSKKKQRCPMCNKSGVSKWEKVVKNFLVELNIDYTPNDRAQLVNPNTNRTLELDLWFPKLNKAIECNGLYWHSLEKAIKRDKIKKQLCKDQGIDLLIVTEKEWDEGIDKCKKKIQDFLLVCSFVSTKEIKKETEIKNER